jgi:hypothetical protein
MNGVGQVRGMKVRSSVKRFCDGCAVVRRYVFVWPRKRFVAWHMIFGRADWVERVGSTSFAQRTQNTSRYVALHVCLIWTTSVADHSATRIDRSDRERYGYAHMPSISGMKVA